MPGSSNTQDRACPYKALENRWFLLVVGVMVISLLWSACAAPTPRVYRVGILVGAETMIDAVDAFKIGMTDLGYIEGKNITYDVQISNADREEEKRIAGQFVSDQVDLVFAFPGQTARSVKLAAQGTDIPVVFASAVLEGADLVDSVDNPGGNITGVRTPGPEMVLKSFESLLEFTPRFERIMVICDPNYPTIPPILEILRTAALSSNVTLQEVYITNVENTQSILQELETSGNANMDAILLLQDTIPRSLEVAGLILDFADARLAPVAGGPEALVQKGAVLSVITNIFDQGKLAAPLADKILRGTPAGTIPVVSPQPQLIINFKKAQELGLTVPQGLLKQATEIIR